MQRVRLPATITPFPIQTAAATLPVPVAAGGGGDISGGRDQEGFSAEDWNIHIAGSAATVLTGPVALYGEKDSGELGFIGKLNNGEDIRIASAAVGFDEPVAGAGLFKRLLVGGLTGTVTPSGGATVTVTALPIWMKK